jgi:eukaryotic-like serine/threonine-protein kinase
MPPSQVLAALGVDATLTLPSLQAASDATPAGEPDPDRTSPGLVAGSTVGRFAVKGELGRGGMGQVLLVRDPDLGRDVALKTVVDSDAEDAPLLRRFVSEARITAQLQHQNVVPVHEFGATEDGRLFFVMARLGGDTLKAVLEAVREGEGEAERRWTRHRLLSAFLQVCNAVSYAHSRGVLHRDLKPSNVMLGRYGEVSVVDWGLARFTGSGPEKSVARALDEGGGGPQLRARATLDGTMIGTPGYMSPEQALGKLDELDERSDIWSLGAVLYEILTLRRAYTGSSTYTIVYRSIQGPPPPPSERAPERRIPAEIAEVCLKAISGDPADRYASVEELTQAVQDFLEGTRRREAARGFFETAQRHWEWCAALHDEETELLERERELATTLDPWLPLSEKAELVEAGRRLAGLATDLAEGYERAVSGCEQALSHDPDHPNARALLADIYLDRFHRAERDSEAGHQRYFEHRVQQYDDGRHASVLRGTGALSLVTDPPGALVLCERLDRTGLVARPGERRNLGTTPLREVPLEMGSYLVHLRYPGREVASYPVHITRGHHWHASTSPVRLYTRSEIGEGFSYVPGGPFQCGGDPMASDPLPEDRPVLPGFFISVLPVTMAAYQEFLSALHARDPDEAWKRVPRKNPRSGHYFERPPDGGSYAFAEADPDGDRIDPAWPVMAVSWHDALAWGTWRSERDGVQLTLPSDLQWEKAARGVDGRLYPWGEGFDPTLCKMRQSRPGRPLPEPVGTFVTDVSVYGVRDLGGSSRDWIGDLDYDGDPERRSVRGGSWSTHPRVARGATRFGHVAWNVATDIGFRVVRAQPLPGRSG